MMADTPTSLAGDSHESGGERSPQSGVLEQDGYLPIANISRIMKKALPLQKMPRILCRNASLNLSVSLPFEGDTKGSARSADGSGRRDAVGVVGPNAQVDPLHVVVPSLCSNK